MRTHRTRSSTPTAPHPSERPLGRSTPSSPVGVRELRLDELDEVVAGRATILEVHGSVNLFRVAA